MLSLESFFHTNGKKYEICYLQKLVQPKDPNRKQHALSLDRELLGCPMLNIRKNQLMVIVIIK